MTQRIDAPILGNQTGLSTVIPTAVSPEMANPIPKLGQAIPWVPLVVTPSAGSKPSGLVEYGNIDLSTRPKVKNADGSISTVRSVAWVIDGQTVLLPTVTDKGKIVTSRQALKLYQKTGKHLGKFVNESSADQYARLLHEDQYSRTTGMKTFLPGVDEEDWTRRSMAIRNGENRLMPSYDPGVLFNPLGLAESLSKTRRYNTDDLTTPEDAARNTKGTWYD